MKELKFRAWDTKGDPPYMLGPYDLTDAIFNHKDIRSLDLMQFTGLKDSIGTEMYEKDIVRILYTDWPSKTQDDPRSLDQYLTDIASIKVIVWNYNGFFLSHKEEGYVEDICPGKHGYIKVIGNIYENPELLK